MKFISIDKVKPNMILDMDIRSFNGKILYEKGTILDEQKIKIIKNNGIFKIPIKNISNEKKLNSYIHTTISKELLEKSFLKTKKIFETLMNTGELNMSEVEEVTAEIINEMSNNFSDKIFVPLKKLKSYDDYLFSHSLNVMILSALIALDMGVKDDELYEIALSGILHDVGKTKIPLEILNAPRKLSS
jgi:HD-GYP domain-containing protein (c-di-GMP phosphodiesterase class II)